MAKVNITFPVGRLVQGSLYDPSTQDANGNPLTTKTGANAGQPRVDYWFRLAIPKGAEGHWANTPWGQQIWQIGHAAFPQVASAPGFSWKVEDGDDATPNIQRKGRRNCDAEGWPGHWIIKFSGGFAPKVYRAEGAGWAQIMEKDAVKPGYWIEVAGSVDSNNNAQKPGVYVNHSMVCFRGYGPEIVFGPDVASAGFGASPLPAGVSMAPLPSAAPMPAAAPMPGAPAVPPLPGAAVPAAPGSTPSPIPAAAGASGVPGMTPSPSSPIPVVPAPGFVQVPPPAPAPAPAAPVRQMTAAANGIPYEAYAEKGWTDAMLVANGLMLA